VCNKIVDSDRGVAKTYKGNYTDFLRQKEEDIVKQWTAFEKWNKEVAKQKDIIRRCSACLCHACCTPSQCQLELPRTLACVTEVFVGLQQCTCIQALNAAMPLHCLAAVRVVSGTISLLPSSSSCMEQKNQVVYRYSALASFSKFNKRRRHFRK
jgi:hypothetical protein